MMTKESIFEIIKWITPVILFFLGFLINALFTLIKAFKQRKIQREFVYSTVRSLSERNKRQKIEVLECIKRLEDIDNSNILISKVTGNETDDLKEITPTIYYTIFYLKNKTEKKIKQDTYRKFRDNLDFLEEFYIGLFENNLEVFKRININIESFNEGYNKIIDAMNEFITININNKIHKGEDPFIDEVFSTIKGLFEKYGNTIEAISIIYENVIQKFTGLCKEYSNDPRTVYFLRYVQSSKLAYLKILSERKNHLENLRNKVIKLDRSNDLLSEAIDSFESSNYKY